MSTPVIDKVSEIQDYVILGIASVKEPATNAVTTVVDFVTGRVETVPAVPFAERIPTPKEVINNSAKFASNVVSTSKDVALSVAKAAAPVTDQLLDRKSAKKTAKKVAKNVESIASVA
jgi:predicted NAD/FAD-binding protein